MHLVINQSTDRTEQVTTACIDKLYNLSKGNTLDSTSYLRGRINAVAAYEDAVTYLNTMWGPDLIVTSDYAYIRFADQNLLQILLDNNIGDGTGITTAAAAAATIGKLFEDTQNSSVIQTFDELPYFKAGINSNNSNNNRTWFYNCSNLTSVDITGIEKLGGDKGLRFRNCPLLKRFNGQNSVDNKMFVNYNPGPEFIWYCDSLYEVEFSDNVSLVDQYAFRYNSNLSKITLNSAIHFNSTVFGNTSITEMHFSSMDDLYHSYSLGGILSGNGHIYINGQLLSPVVEFPEGVTDWGNLLQNCQDITKLIIPTTATNQGSLGSCNSLQSIVYKNTNAIPSSGNYNYWNCTYPDRSIYVYSMAAWVAFDPGAYGNSFFQSNTYTNNHLYLNDSLVTSVTIPNTVSKIGNFAFFRCHDIASLSFESNSACTSIGVSAFEETAITSVVLPNTITTLNENAFRKCQSLTSVSLPSGLTTLPKNCFNQCTNLTSVIIPDNVTSIDAGAFSGCSGLTSITIPNSVTSIGSSAFSNCHMNSIILNEGLLDIDSYAFQGNDIVSITIPASVQTLSGLYGCVDRCSQLQSFIFLGTTPPSINQTWLFYGVPNTCKIYVPDEYISAYEAALSVKNQGLVDRLTPMSQLPT